MTTATAGNSGILSKSRSSFASIYTTIITNHQNMRWSIGLGTNIRWKCHCGINKAFLDVEVIASRFYPQQHWRTGKSTVCILMFRNGGIHAGRNRELLKSFKS
jgi:hypothetical protein